MRVLASARVFAGAALFSCLSSAVCGQELKHGHSEILILTEKDNNRAVEIRVSEEIEVRLPEDVGERWVVENHVGDFVALLALKSARAIGSNGMVAFVFRGKKAGTEEITLQHSRGSTVIDRFRFEVRVLPYK